MFGEISGLFTVWFFSEISLSQYVQIDETGYFQTETHYPPPPHHHYYTHEEKKMKEWGKKKKPN